MFPLGIYKYNPNKAKTARLGARLLRVTWKETTLTKSLKNNNDFCNKSKN